MIRCWVSVLYQYCYLFRQQVVEGGEGGGSVIHPRGRSGSRIGAARDRLRKPPWPGRCISVIHAARRTSPASASDVTALRNSMDKASSFLQSTGAPGMPWRHTEGRPVSKVERKCVYLRAAAPLRGRGRHMGVEGGLQYLARANHLYHCLRPKISIVPRSAGWDDAKRCIGCGAYE